MKKHVPGFAVIRIARDQLRIPRNDADFEALVDGAIKVVSVFFSLQDAKAEAGRLNELQKGKGLYYYCQHTHIDSNP